MSQQLYHREVEKIGGFFTGLLFLAVGIVVKIPVVLNEETQVAKEISVG